MVVFCTGFGQVAHALMELQQVGIRGLLQIQSEFFCI